MDLTGFVKRLRLPEGFTPPRELVYEDIRARAITRADLAEDVRGINASLELIPVHRPVLLEPRRVTQ